MNPSFNFIFGKPANEGSGRWVEGTIAQNGCGYKFTVRLMLRRGAILSCQPAWIEIDRPFAATDFAAYLRLVSAGPLTTVTRACSLYETRDLETEMATAIFEATAEWVDPWDHESLPLLNELALLGDRLEQARKREMLHLAISNSWHGTRTFDETPE